MEEVHSGWRAFVPLDVPHRENLELCCQSSASIRKRANPELDELNLAWHRLAPSPDAVAGSIASR
jgi:2-haloacid dehalogenase